MKRIILILLACLATSGAMAQLAGYGIQAGLGTATIKDDLGIRSPLLGFNVGPYFDITLQHNQTVLAEIFYLRTGLNLIRRGGNFEEVLENENTMSIRTGYYHAYYMQLPLLAGLHFELPVRQAGHVVGIVVGPAVSYGLIGAYSDRKVSPGLSTRQDNYDIAIHGTDDEKQLFNHINRLDVSAIIGATYERGPFTFSVFVDYGFLATSEGTDVLRILDQSLGETDINVNIPNGNNMAVMFSLAYKLGSLGK